MHLACNRRMLFIALAAVLVSLGLLATPLGIAGMAQSSQAAVGARLMRGAVDLHYHVDPGYGTYENLVQAKAAGVRALLLKNHYEPTAALVMLLRPQFPGLQLYAGFVFNRSNGGVNVAGVEYMASIKGEPKPGKIVWLPAGDTEKEARGGRNPNPNAPFVAVSRNGQLLPEVEQALAVIAKNNPTLASRPRSCRRRAARVPRGQGCRRAADDRDARGGPDWQDDPGSNEGSRETRRLD